MHSAINYTLMSRWGEWNTPHPLNMIYFIDIQFAPRWPVLSRFPNFDLK
jgi:hypothetical protein